ncbi:hypothetical protein [uncultured Shewanella sp.]|uniref:hypothetical protein n=1 Tax=uncultured Shewanella sp. TaxID=173975 RepID=UPI002627B969|nr:hypothetical protein [uncultured Shewanella sp.]
MLPIQEIKIITKNKREFFVHLEKWAEDRFDVKLAVINLGDKPSNHIVFIPFSKGKNANDAFRNLIEGLKEMLLKDDSTDFINEINNVCGDELIDKESQEKIIDSSVTVKKNGR